MILSDLFRAVADVFYKKALVPATARVTKTATGEFDPWAYDTNGNCYIDPDEWEVAWLDWFNKIITDAQFGMVQVLYWDHIENPSCVHEIHGLYIVFWNIAYFFGGLGWDTLTSWFNDASQYCKDISDNLNSAADTLDTWWDTISAAVSDISDLFGDIADVITWVKAIPEEIATWGEGLIDDVVDWVKAIPDEIATYVGGIADDIKAWVEETYTDIATWVTEHASDIWTAITGLAVDFATWLAGLAADMWYAITGLAVDFATWLAGLPADIWEAINGFVADLIAAAILPFAPVLDWYNEVKDNVLTFVQDPWDWLEAKFTDWFLGKE